MLTDKVYDDIKKKILNLTLKPGSNLDLAELRSTYGVSNSPVRDALKHLEAEGLVNIKPQSGTSVAKINLSTVEDERFRRLYLEIGAVEQAFMKGISNSTIKEFSFLVDQQKTAFNNRNSELFLVLDDKMHRLFFEECGHEKVFDSIMATSGNYSRIRMVSYLFEDVFRCSLDQHTEILRALTDGNSDKVISLERSHISRIEHETLEYRKTYPQYFN